MSRSIVDGASVRNLVIAGGIPGTVALTLAIVLLANIGQRFSHWMRHTIEDNAYLETDEQHEPHLGAREVVEGFVGMVITLAKKQLNFSNTNLLLCFSRIGSCC